MRMSEYLIEAVARRKSGKYISPSRPDKELIIRFLEDHGFRKVEYGDEWNHSSGRVYSLGKFDSDPGTHWVRFIDNTGEKNLYFCRLDNFGRRGFVDFQIIDSNGKRIEELNFQDFAKRVEDEFC